MFAHAYCVHVCSAPDLNSCVYSPFSSSDLPVHVLLFSPMKLLQDKIPQIHLTLGASISCAGNMQ